MAMRTTGGRFRSGAAAGALVLLVAAWGLGDPGFARSAAVPPPTAGPQLYTIGQLRWTFEGDAPPEKRAAIVDAMDWAVNEANTLADFAGNVTVVYNRDTPTADANFESRIQFGGSINRQVALHELAHWLGSGTHDRWDGTLAEGRFMGATAAARMQAFDGAGAVPHADRMHFWPYGLNHDHEFAEPQRNVQMVSAQRSDMALGDEAHAIDGERRFLNRAAPVVLAGARTVPWDRSTRAAWQARCVDGFVTLRDPAGRALGRSGAAAALVPAFGPPSGPASGPASGDAAQQWEMLPTDAGWFRLRNRQSQTCLTAEAGLALRPCAAAAAAAAAQQWHLAR